MSDSWIEPDWSDKHHVHNWRNYVNEGLRAIWSTFTDAQKKAIYENASEQADNEEWD